MKLQDLVEIIYKEWAQREAVGQPKEVASNMQAFEKSLGQVITETEVREHISELNGVCTAAYEEYGFRQGFKAAAGILQALNEG